MYLVFKYKKVFSAQLWNLPSISWKHKLDEKKQLNESPIKC